MYTVQTTATHVHEALRTSQPSGSFQAINWLRHVLNRGHIAMYRQGTNENKKNDFIETWWRHNPSRYRCGGRRGHISTWAAPQGSA